MQEVSQVRRLSDSEPRTDNQIASAIKALVARGESEQARQRFGELVARHQRRASRIALHYVRDPADADEAVQDAFVKTYSRLHTFRDELPFEVWFTRILINGCLDRLKARARRDRWFVRMLETVGYASESVGARPAKSPEELLLLREQAGAITKALQRLPDRQRLVFVLAHFEHHSFREISAMTGLAESTIRVHLFRAVRALRGLLAASAVSAAAPVPGRRTADRGRST